MSKGACSGKKSRRPSASGGIRIPKSQERTKRKRNAHFAENAQILLKKLEISTDRMSKLLIKKDFANCFEAVNKSSSVPNRFVLVVTDTSVCMRNGSAFRKRYDLSPDVFRAQFLEIFCHFEHFPRNEHSDFSSHVVGGIKKAGRRFFFTASALTVNRRVNC